LPRVKALPLLECFTSRIGAGHRQLSHRKPERTWNWARWFHRLARAELRKPAKANFTQCAVSGDISLPHSQLFERPEHAPCHDKCALERWPICIDGVVEEKITGRRDAIQVGYVLRVKGLDNGVIIFPRREDAAPAGLSQASAHVMHLV
jgi:hypothetical protein